MKNITFLDESLSSIKSFATNHQYEIAHFFDKRQRGICLEGDTVSSARDIHEFRCQGNDGSQLVAQFTEELTTIFVLRVFNADSKSGRSIDSVGAIDDLRRIRSDSDLRALHNYISVWDSIEESVYVKQLKFNSAVLMRVAAKTEESKMNPELIASVLGISEAQTSNLLNGKIAEFDGSQLADFITLIDCDNGFTLY